MQSSAGSMLNVLLFYLVARFEHTVHTEHTYLSKIQLCLGSAAYLFVFVGPPTLYLSDTKSREEEHVVDITFVIVTYLKISPNNKFLLPLLPTQPS